MDILNGNEEKRAESYCLRLLAIRPRSEYEIAKSLEGKGYSSLCAGSVIGELKRKKLIDDLAFARNWIDRRLAENPRSASLIRHELAGKGIQPGVIEEAAKGFERELDDRKIALRIVRSRASRIAALPDDKIKLRLFQALLNRGFDVDTAEEAVNGFLKGLE
jgi:regulatory protein